MIQATLRRMRRALVSVKLRLCQCRGGLAAAASGVCAARAAPDLARPANVVVTV